jgi:putative redox protein
MPVHEVKTIQKEGMTLEVFLPDGNIILDVPESEGGNGNGVKPKQLMLAAMEGCTAMDVVSLLKKMKIDYQYFEVKAEAILSEEHPMHYTDVKLTYIFKGNSLNKEKIQRAVELSFDKYCGVIYMFKQFAKVDYSIQYIE